MKKIWAVLEKVLYYFFLVAMPLLGIKIFYEIMREENYTRTSDAFIVGLMATGILAFFSYQSVKVLFEWLNKLDFQLPENLKWFLRTLFIIFFWGTIAYFVIDVLLEVASS
ncbi:MAG: hypothetical protein WDN67_00590 [Candidatus Moraniibacteriota bacterium]